MRITVRTAFLSIQMAMLSLLFALPALACDCGLNSIPDIPGETKGHRFVRGMSLDVKTRDIVVVGRFVSVRGIDGLFRSSRPRGRFEVTKAIKGNTARFLTVYTDKRTDCSAPWIFEDALKRRDEMVISLEAREDRAGVTYEINLCDIYYHPADLRKPSFEEGSNSP